MIDMPPECPPGMSIVDVINIRATHLINHDGSDVYPCFIQTPENLIDNPPKGYPYFDFEAARKENAGQLQELSVLSAEMSPGEFYLALLLGGITFLAFAVGFLAGFIPQG
ncbi:hypothetical protein P4K07_004210 [Salmonella enterica]|nr:hypothetical protein [Salmonella enterica]